MQQLARRIYQLCHTEGEFLLRSGQISHHYFDKYQLESQPDVLADIAQALVPLIPSDTDLLAGLEMGGIPVVTMLSHFSGIPCVFVRKKAKTYGTAKLAEGPDIAGKKLCIVEDVVTSGGQIVISAGDLRERGAVIDTALCVIDRESGGPEALTASGLSLRQLFTASELQSAQET